MVETLHYRAAGGVLVHGDRILLLRRRSRGETRLPKGHIEPGETPADTALREVGEESGYTDIAILADLGHQTVQFDHAGKHIHRLERYYLMELTGPPIRTGGEPQFEPYWASWEEALTALTFESEREWIRRARVTFEKLKGE